MNKEKIILVCAILFAVIAIVMFFTHEIAIGLGALACFVTLVGAYSSAKSKKEK